MRLKTRSLTIADAMILVAACAAGVFIAREYVGSLTAAIPGPAAIRTWMLLISVPSAVAAPLMLALLAFQVRRPRPGRSRLARQPGFAACCAATAGLGYGAIGQLVFQNSPVSGGWSDAFTFYYSWSACTGYAQPAVVGAWLLLIVSRRWRAEPTWADRAGRLIGAWWIGSLGLVVGSGAILGWLPAS